MADDSALRCIGRLREAVVRAGRPLAHIRACYCRHWRALEAAGLADSFGGALRLLVVFVASLGVTVPPWVQTG